MRRTVARAVLRLPIGMAMIWSVAVSAEIADAPALMPLPRTVAIGESHLPLSGAFAANWSGCHGAALDRSLSRLQSDISRRTGVVPDTEKSVSLDIACKAPGAVIAPDRDEAYRLTVAKDGIRIDAEGAAGVLRAFATLRQLVTLRRGQPEIVHASIDDAPRFAWRGVLLDVARHFITASTIERQIDAMERVKLNVLHLHLSDNEGFRVESKRYPRLNTVSSHGQYFTQDEVRRLVAYAADRGVLIVPEFDVPGHTRAIVDAYPEIGLSAPGSLDLPFPPDVALNPASPRTYRFLRGLIKEMASLFPGPYFHIGGDEVSDAVWADSAGVKELMARENLASKRDVEGYFARRVIELVRDAGKTAIGWEEIAAAGVPSDVLIQAWQTSNAAAAATAKGHRTIVSAGYYLDLLMPADFHYAMDPTDSSAAGFTPEEAERARKLNPILARVLTDALVAKPLPPLTPGQEKLVIGGEAPLWGELVTDEMVDHRLWPRAAALAERFWSPASVRDPIDMYRRLAVVHDQLTIGGLAGDAHRRRMALRLAPGSADAVHTLLGIVTPVRNMAHDHRILAALRGQRIVQPLNSLADAAPADSLIARRFAADAQRFIGGEAGLEPKLRAQLAIWRDNHARFAAVAQGNAMLEPALPTSASIAALARIGLAAVDALAAGKRLDDETAAQAELLLAQAEKDDAASRKPLLSFLQTQPSADLIIAITPGVRMLVTEARRTASAQEAAREGLRYVDYYSALATADGALKPGLSIDGVHPNRDGYAAMHALAASVR